ncbi:hypothetical protein MKX54_04365 [Alkalihalobacillus sp. FSL R5-0424]
MQAMRIKHIAHEARGKTVLIVVGHLHKPDIEQILAENNEIELVPPSTYGYPTEPEIKNQFESKDASFILAFNLLGLQSQYDIEVNWLRDVLEKLPREQIVEKKLYQLRLGTLTEELQPTDVIKEYKELADGIGWEERFLFQTFNPTSNRMDSYYDPFGNVSVKARIYIELAREYAKQASYQKADELKAYLLEASGWTLEEKLRLEGYWEEFVLAMY